MNIGLIIDSIGAEGLALMAVCFVAVVWWGFRKPNTDDDKPWPGEDGQ